MNTMNTFVGFPKKYVCSDVMTFIFLRYHLDISEWWKTTIPISAAGYDDLLSTTLQKQRGAAEKGSGLALADPHTRTKQNV